MQRAQPSYAGASRSCTLADEDIYQLFAYPNPPIMALVLHPLARPIAAGLLAVLVLLEARHDRVRRLLGYSGWWKTRDSHFRRGPWR